MTGAFKEVLAAIAATEARMSSRLGGLADRLEAIATSLARVESKVDGCVSALDGRQFPGPSAFVLDRRPAILVGWAYLLAPPRQVFFGTPVGYARWTTIHRVSSFWTGLDDGRDVGS